MLDLYQRRKLQAFMYSKPFLVVLGCLVSFFAYVAFNAYSKAVEANAKRIELAAELADLEHRASVLERDLAHLNDPRGVEAALRKRYEVGREGEELVVLVEEEKPVEEHIVPVEEQTWWERVKGWF